MSILRRYCDEKSPARGDHKHVHHCLRRYGLSVNQTSVTLWIAVLATGTMGIVFRFAYGSLVGVASLAFVGLEIYLAVRLGCLDVRNLWGKLVGSYRWKLVTHEPAKSDYHMAELETIWERMKPLFEQTNLDRAVLTLEGITRNGKTKYQTYRWVRSEKLMAELLSSRWTKRFPLGQDKSRVAVLRLESAEHLRRDEQRIDWILKQISDNMRQASVPNKQENEELVESVMEQ